MKAGAWWNGALTIIELVIIGIFLRGVWKHDMDEIFFGLMFGITFGATWVGTLLEMNKR